MGLHDDISWQELRRIVHQWAGASAELAEMKPLLGGSVNNTLMLSTEAGDRAVLKISPHRVTADYRREAHQLKLLRKLGVPTPEVYRYHVATLDDPNSYILMEYVEGFDLAQARELCSPDDFDDLQSHLGEVVAHMHAHAGHDYRRVRCEAMPRFSRWTQFFRSVYDPILHASDKAAHLPVKARKVVGKIHERLENLIDHPDRPRLVHFDLWANNVLCRPDRHGRWKVAALIDPNCKFAHAEAEIAYMDLFKTSTKSFSRAYQSHFRLGDDYHRCRKLVYQLYPMLDHLQLLGKQYLAPCLAAVDRASCLV